MLPKLNSGKLKPKKLTDAQITGQQGVNLIESVVLDMGFIWNPTNLDVGIDGYVEIRDASTGAASNCIIQVQSKATAEVFAAETNTGFEYLCDERDLNYWLNGNAPVILVRSRPKTGEAYWIDLKDYFQDLGRRKSRKIVFDKTRDRFDGSTRDNLLRLAVPADSGLYLAPVPKVERLCSNLVPLLSFPEHIYIAETECRFPKDIWSVCDRAGSAWLLKNKQIISFYDLREHPWTDVSDRGSVEEHFTDEWAHSDDPDIQRDFVWLLNKALQDLLRSQVIWFDRRELYYYYAPTKDLNPRRVTYHSNQHKAQRTVFQGYPQKRDKTKMSYYRHSAFEGRFVRYGDAWYLQLNPTYRFTFDGRNIHRDAANLLSRIKRMERSGAVQGQVVMWSRILSGTSAYGLFAGQDLLTFGNLLGFELDAGIEDQAWLKHEEDEAHIKTATDDEWYEENDGLSDGQLTLII